MNCQEFLRPSLFSFLIPRTFDGTMSSLAKKKWTTKLSSAGLIYLHFGHQVLSEVFGGKTSSKDLEILYEKIYENFIEEIDAVDNGINQYDGEPRFVFVFIS